MSAGGEVDLRASLEIPRKVPGIERLLVGGGVVINGSFLAEGLIDDLDVLVAPAFDARVGMERIFSHGEDVWPEGFDCCSGTATVSITKWST